MSIAIEIKETSPLIHKETGFDKGWTSMFDTWYKLPMEFGFALPSVFGSVIGLDTLKPRVEYQIGYFGVAAV